MLDQIKEGTITTVRVLIKNTEQKTGQRGPYTSVTFTDGKSEITSNVWVPLNAYPYKGKVVDLNLTVRNGFVNIVDTTEVIGADIKQYLPHAPIDSNGCMKMIEDELELIKSPEIKAVAQKNFSENKEKFEIWSAAKSVHHNYINGLLYHTCRMLANVKTVASVYGLNRDLLTAGVVLHDIGKLQELDMDETGNTNYSVKGNLFGHLYIGAEMISDAAEKLGLDRDCEDLMLLRHMILAHHKEPEFGAVKRPAIPEAYALCMLDDLDSSIWVYDKNTQELEPGTCSAQIRALGNAVVYRPAAKSNN